jgi:hypothetical protein
MKLMRIAKLINKPVKEIVTVLIAKGAVVKKSPLTILDDRMINILSITYKIDVRKLYNVHNKQEQNAPNKPKKNCKPSTSKNITKQKPQLKYLVNTKAKIVNNICDKKSYATQRDAQEQINTIKLHSSRSQIPQRAYHCPTCEYWHLSSKSEGKPKRNWK